MLLTDLRHIFIRMGIAFLSFVLLSGLEWVFMI